MKRLMRFKRGHANDMQNMDITGGVFPWAMLDEVLPSGRAAIMPSVLNADCSGVIK